MPEISFQVGHGQMDEKQLEKVMLDFVDKRFQVLVCTTIIESGLDIPNCNTIIIEGADRFGLGQLYQIRGRVGRFKRQAYAYLLLHKHKRLMDIARKRLKAIRQHNQLGAGLSDRHERPGVARGGEPVGLGAKRPYSRRWIRALLPAIAAEHRPIEGRRNRSGHPSQREARLRLPRRGPSGVHQPIRRRLHGVERCGDRRDGILRTDPSSHPGQLLGGDPTCGSIFIVALAMAETPERIRELEAAHEGPIWPISHKSWRP